MKNKKTLSGVFLHTIRRNPALAALTVFFILASILLTLIPPLVLGRIVDDLTQKKTVTALAVVLYFGATALSGISDMIRESMITVLGQKSMHELRTALAEKTERMRADYFVKHEPGKTASLFVNDVGTIDALFTNGIVSMFTDACKIVSILAVIAVKSKGLAILLILVTPLLFAFTRFCQKQSLAAQKANRAAVADANQKIPETIRNLRTIRALHVSGFMERRYDEAIRDSFAAQEKVNLFDAGYSPVIMISSALIVAVMMAGSVSGGEAEILFGMTAGTASALISYVSKIFSPIESIGMEIQNIQSAAAGAARIREFLNEPENASAMEGTVDLPQGSGMQGDTVVEVRNLTFGYEPGRELFSDYSMDVHRGERVTLAGRTGIGKSTLLKLVLGLYEPTAGEVRVFGMPADRIPAEEKRSLYGYVEQQFRPVPGTIRNQVTLGDPSVTDDMVVKSLRTVGLYETVMKEKGGLDVPCTEQMFSQGEFQLLSIARAIAKEPKLLLLDEITANLDSGTETRVLEAIGQAMENRTVISVSHRIRAGEQVKKIGEP